VSHETRDKVFGSRQTWETYEPDAENVDHSGRGYPEHLEGSALVHVFNKNDKKDANSTNKLKEESFFIIHSNKVAFK
jgi:hypothetical protein